MLFCWTIFCIKYFVRYIFACNFLKVLFASNCNRALILKILFYIRIGVNYIVKQGWQKSKKAGNSHIFQDSGKYWYFLGITGTSQNHSTTIHAVYLILGLNQTCCNVDNNKAHLVCYDILSYCF